MKSGIIIAAALMLLMGLLGTVHAAPLSVNAITPNSPIADLVQANVVTGTIVGFNVPEGIAIAPDGQYAYVSNWDNNTISVVNLATNTISNTITGFLNAPWGIAFTPDGQYAYVTEYAGGEIRIVDTSTNTLLPLSSFSSVGLGIGPQGISIAPDGQYAYVADFRTANSVYVVEKISLVTNSVSGTLTGFNAPTDVAIAPDGQYAYVANDGNDTVSIVSTSNGMITNTIALTGTTATGPAVKFAPSGAFAYLVSFYNTNITVINTSTNSVYGLIPGFGDAQGIAITPDGRSAYVTDWSNNTASSVTLSAAPPITLTASWSGGTPPYTATWYTGSSATCASDTTVVSTSNSVSSPASNVIAPTSNAFYCLSITDSSAPSHLTSNSPADYVTIYPPLVAGMIRPSTGTSGTLADFGTTASYPNQIAFSSNGLYAYIGDSNAIASSGPYSTVRVVSNVSNTVVDTITGFNQQSFGLDFGLALAPGSNTLYVANENSTISVVNTITDMEAGLLVQPYTGYPTLSSIKASPDGKSLYLVNPSVNYIDVYNASTGRQTGRIAGFNSPYSMAVSPDGRQLYVGNSGNQTISVFGIVANSITGTLIGVSLPSPPPAYNYTCTNETAGGNGYSFWILATGSTSDSITGTISSNSQPVLLLPILPHTNYISQETSFAALPMAGDPPPVALDNTYLCYNSVYNVAFDIDVTGVTANTITGTMKLQSSPFDSFSALAVSPDGNYLYIADRQNDSVDALKIATDAVTSVTPDSNGDPYAIAVSKNGNYLYVADSDTSLSVVRTANSAILGTVSSPDFTLINDLAVSRDGKSLYVANPDTSSYDSDAVYIVNTTNSIVTGDIPGFTPNLLALSPTANTLYVENDTNLTISSISLATRTGIGTILFYALAGINNMAISPDGRYLYLSDTSGYRVDVIDTADNLMANILTGFNDPSGLAMSPDGKYLYVSDEYATTNEINVVSIATNSIIANISNWRLDAPFGMSVSPDGKSLYVTNKGNANGNTVDVINTTTRRVTTVIEGFDSPWNIAVAPNGKYAYVSDQCSEYCSGDSSVTILELPLLVVPATALGQSAVTLTATPTGGTLSYSYQWYFSYSPKCSAGTPIAGATSQTYNVVIGNAYYCYRLTDSATIQNPVLSQTDLVRAELINNTRVLVAIPSGSPTGLDFEDAASTLSVNTTTPVVANVVVSNVTSLYSTTPTANGTSFTKVVVLDVSISQNAPANLAANLTIDYPCGTSPVPYELVGGAWTALPYTLDTSACTITVKISLDPIVGLFTSAPSTGTGSSGGSGGAGTPASSSSPEVTLTRNGCVVTNLTEGSSETCRIGNLTFDLVQGAISIKNSTTDVNGRDYTLNTTVAAYLESASDSAYYLSLLDINYTNLKAGAPTVDLEIYSRPLPGPTTVTTTIATTAPTTAATTVQSTAPTTIPAAAPQAQPGYGLPILIALIIIAMAAAALYMLLRRRRRQ